MRNLVEYPITEEEAINLLDELSEVFHPDLVGDPRPAIIEWIKEKITEKKCMCP